MLLQDRVSSALMQARHESRSVSLLLMDLDRVAETFIALHSAADRSWRSCGDCRRQHRPGGRARSRVQNMLSSNRDAAIVRAMIDRDATLLHNDACLRM